MRFTFLRTRNRKSCLRSNLDQYHLRPAVNDAWDSKPTFPQNFINFLSRYHSRWLTKELRNSLLSQFSSTTWLLPLSCFIKRFHSLLAHQIHINCWFYFVCWCHDLIKLLESSKLYNPSFIILPIDYSSPLTHEFASTDPHCAEYKNKLKHGSDQHTTLWWNDKLCCAFLLSHGFSRKTFKAWRKENARETTCTVTLLLASHDKLLVRRALRNVSESETRATFRGNFYDNFI